MEAETISEPGSQFPTGSKANRLHCFKQAPRHLSPWLNKGGQPLSKDLAKAANIAAEELAHREAEHDLSAPTGNISQRPPIHAVDLRRCLSAEGTTRRREERDHSYCKASILRLEPLNSRYEQSAYARKRTLLSASGGTGQVCANS